MCMLCMLIVSFIVFHQVHMENILCTSEDIMLTGEATLVIYSFIIQVGCNHHCNTVTCSL